MNEKTVKKLYIIKVGTTFPAILEKLGDFDTWTAAALGEGAFETVVVDAEHGAWLPYPEECAGAVITGSHSMVTDDHPWSLRVEEWIRLQLKARKPLLGICYGHQLLARAACGRVGFHPGGREIGTVEVRLTPDCVGDPLFGDLPTSFHVHVTHSQTVLHLPPGARRLAANAFEPNHAFRLGNRAWGVQFHPEYTIDVMLSYINEQADELESSGLPVHDLLGSVAQTPTATRIIRNFAHFVELDS